MPITRRLAWRAPLATLLALCTALLPCPPAAASDAHDAQVIVDNARHTLARFMADPDMTWFHSHMRDARALMIVPELVKAGFIIGGSLGRGVLLMRDPETHKWSMPAFYDLASGSIGLQIGAESSQVALVVMTRHGADAMLSTKLQLGADASVAAGPIGQGIAAASADVLSFARSKGAFAGLSLEGASITPDDDRNRTYYGRDVTPADILVRHVVSNKGARALIEAVREASRVR